MVNEFFDVAPVVGPKTEVPPDLACVVEAYDQRKAIASRRGECERNVLAIGTGVIGLRLIVIA